MSDRDTCQLIDDFLIAIAAYGFDACAAGGWTGIGRKRVHRFYFNTWPADWLALYQAGGFADDPAILEAQRRITPFLWNELDPYRSRNPASGRLLDAAAQYGWADGLVIPVHGPAGYQGVVSLAAFEKLSLHAEDMTLLWIAALNVHARCRSSLGLGESTAASPKISARECECMRWVAAGKTDWEIAKLLGISASTVHFHVERVKKRLVTSTRSQAVALLVLHGIL